MNSHVRLYRKRFIPEETVLLKDDTILFFDDSVIITSWKTLKPRKDFASGLSAYYRKEGFKISRILDAEQKFVRWYCDIIEEQPANDDSNGLVFVDLLIDIVVMPDGSVKVMDLGEAADALKEGLITQEMLLRAMHTTDTLLSLIYSGNFPSLTKCIEPYIKQQDC